MPENFQVLQPPPHVFSDRTNNVVEQVLTQKQLVPVFEGIEFPDEGGMALRYMGVPHPKKGFPYPEALGAINSVKRFTMFFTVFSKLFRRGFFENLIFHYTRLCEWQISSHFLHRRYMNPAAQEIWTFIYLFLKRWGIADSLAYQAGRVFSHLIEYDDAYCLRVQDLFSETTKEKMLKDPQGEIKRLVEIFRDREPALGAQHVGDRFVSIAKLVFIVLLIPSVRRAFDFALRETEFEKLQLDEGDRFWCLNRGDYNFFGQTIEERMKTYHKTFEKTGYPPMLEVQL